MELSVLPISDNSDCTCEQIFHSVMAMEFYETTCTEEEGTDCEKCNKHRAYWFNHELDPEELEDCHSCLEVYRNNKEKPYSQKKIGDYFFLKDNYQEGLIWYKKSAENSALMQYILGHMYEKGECVEEDEEDAVRWYILASANGCGKASYYLGHFYKKKDDLEEAVKWFQIADSPQMIGEMYEEMDDIEEAIKWYIVAAKNGSARSQVYLVDYYEEKGDLEEAVVWMRMLVEGMDAEEEQPQIDPWYYYRLAKLYDDVDNTEETIIWLTRAAECDIIESYHLLAIIYSNEEGYINKELATKWLTLGAEKGDKECMNNLAVQLCQQEKYKKALTWFVLAANLGLEWAMDNVKKMMDVNPDIFFTHFTHLIKENERLTKENNHLMASQKGVLYQESIKEFEEVKKNL